MAFTISAVEPRGDRHQKLVPHQMPQAVVYQLELIQIEKQHRKIELAEWVLGCALFIRAIWGLADCGVGAFLHKDIAHHKEKILHTQMFADFAKQRFVLKKGTTKSDRNGSPLARSGQAWVKGGKRIKRIILMVKNNTTRTIPPAGVQLRRDGAVTGR